MRTIPAPSPEAAARRRAAAAILFAVALATSNLRADQACAGTARVGAPVMGTVLQVTVVAGTDESARALADGAILEARRWDDLLTTWRAEGELARLNARAGEGPVPISAPLWAALDRMIALSAATGGTFDPVAGALAKHWRGDDTVPGIAFGTAIQHRINTALSLSPGMAELKAGTALDAGGIGKGMALDAIAAGLRAAGATCAFLDFGGSSQTAVGVPPDAPQGWKVVVAGLDEGDVAGMMRLRDRSLSTSRAIAAGAAGPIIDPRSGRPVPPPRLATVLAADGATAEAWSKAAIILGRAVLAAAAAHGIEVLYEDAGGRVTTSGFPLAPHAP